MRKGSYYIDSLFFVISSSTIPYLLSSLYFYIQHTRQLTLTLSIIQSPINKNHYFSFQDSGILYHHMV